MSDRSSPHSPALEKHVIHFHCFCGAPLNAEVEHAGQVTVCPSCGAEGRVPIVEVQTHTNPSPFPDRPKETRPAPTSPTAAAVDGPLCSVCQCSIEKDDDQQECARCGQPFHAECWLDNLGCSTYGCQNVGCLKSGPDIRIDAPPPLPTTTYPPPLIRADGADDSKVAASVLVTLTLISGIVGLFTFGTVPAIVGLFLLAGALLELFPCPEGWVVGSILACGLAFAIGLSSSLVLWQ